MVSADFTDVMNSTPFIVQTQLPQYINSCHCITLYTCMCVSEGKNIIVTVLSRGLWSLTMARRCIQVNLYVYYILSPWKQCDFNEGSVIGQVPSFCTVILDRSGSLMAAAHAVGVQKISPVNTEVIRLNSSEKANDIYMKMYILTGSRCSQHPPGTCRDGTKVFQSRRSQRAEQRDIAALGGIHMALLYISTYSA